MPNASPLYVVELTADEVEAVERLLGRRTFAKPKAAPRKAAASAQRRTARPTSLPWRPSGPALQPGYSHTTPELDAWLERRASRDFTPRPIAPPPLSKPKRLTDKQRHLHESAWREYATTGRADGDADPVTEYVNTFARHVALLDAISAARS